MWQFRIFHTHRDSDLEQIEQTRDLIAHSLGVLRNNPAPDTFAGRKTQEPFPEEEDLDTRTGHWMTTKELLPPK